MGQEPNAAEPGSTSFFSFDVLFRRVLGGDRTLVPALHECGFDPDHPADRYPAAVWSGCLELARSKLFPDLPVAQGQRRIGQLFAEGLQKGPVGEAYAGIPLSHEMYLRRLPWLVKQARPEVQIEITCLEPRRWQLDLCYPDPAPWFTVGVLEVRLRDRGIPATVELVHQDAERYRLEIRW